MLANPVPGTAAQVLSAILREDPAGTPGGRATFSLVNLPELPSLGTEVVWLPQYAVLDANGEFTGMLVSQGWATKGVTAVTGAYTPQPSDAVILVNAAGGAVTVTLPDATQPGYSPGQRYTVVKTDSSANAVTVNASAGQLIAGGSAVTLTTASAFTSVVFDGVNTNNWWIWAASATSSGSPSGAAGGALSGSYPNPSLAVPVALSASQNGALLTATNTLSGPTQAPIAVISATAGDRAIGAEVSGDTSYRIRVGSDGKLQWGPGNATQDANLYRSAAGVLKTDQSLTVAGTLTSGSFPVPVIVASTGASGYTLVNGTGNVFTWTAPSDGALHRVLLLATIGVTSATTGGQMQLSGTNPAGTTGNQQFFSTQGTGNHETQLSMQVEAGTTVTLSQNTAMTAGAAVLWADLIAC